MTQVKHSSDTLVFADSSPPNLWSLWWPKGASYDPATGIGGEGVTMSRHKGAGCVVFVDGHCEVRVDQSDPNDKTKYFPNNINPSANLATNTRIDRVNSYAMKWWDPKQRR